jgi:hypothetical protein
MFIFRRLFYNLNTELLKPSYTLDFRIACILFSIFPFTLITGPFLPDLFLSIIAFYFLVISFKNKLFDFYKNKLVIYFSLFYFYILIRGLFSEYPFESLIGYNGPIFYFRYLFFILAIKYLLDNNPKLIKIFFFSLIITLLFTIIDGYLQWISGSNILGFEIQNKRISGFFNDEQILGHFLSHTVPLAIGIFVYIYGTSKKQIFLIMFFLIISEILIFVTNDRAGFLKIFQFSLLIIILSNNFKFFRLISFIFSMLLIILIVNNSSDSKDRYSNTLSEVTATSIPYMPWTALHEKHFIITIDMFKENPLFGKGPQYFRIACDGTTKYTDRQGCTNHPHNYYFQTAAELGIFGLAFLTIAFLYVSIILIKQFIHLWFYRTKRSSLLPDYLIVITSLTFILLWPLIPHQSFYNNWLNSYIYLAFGFTFYLFSKKKSI